MSLFVKIILLLASTSLFIWNFNVVYGQKNVRLERISTNDGLSQADVKCMMEDNFGFLWVGTRDGLNKYDGDKFYRYLKSNNDSTSLDFNQITDLELDSSGNLWIGARNGVSYYDRRTDEFTNYHFSSEDRAFTEVNDIFIHDDKLLVSTNNGLKTFTQGNFVTDPLYEKFKDTFVTQFHSSKQYETWVATTNGLYLKRNGDDNWVDFFNGTVINHLLFEKNKVYVSTSKGLFKYTFHDQSLTPISLPAGNRQVLQCARAKSGELWIACDQVVVLGQDDKTVKHLFSHEKSNAFSLSEDRAQSLYQTSDNVMWIGTFGYGLNKYDPDIGVFSYLGEESSLPLTTNYVSAVFTTDDSTIFVGTSRGLNKIDLQKREVKTFLLESDLSLIHKIKGDADGSIWISASSGLYRYEQNLLTKVRFPRWVAIVDMADWDEQTLLLATGGQGVFLFNKKENSSTTLVPPDSLPGTVFAALRTEDALWLACDDGLRVFTAGGKLKTHFRAGAGPGSLPSNVVKCVFQARSGNLWVGTWGGGLSRINLADSTFTTYDQSKGLPSNVVYGIVEDSSGVLWMSTNLGISAFNTSTNEFRNFDYSDGLQGNEFNTGAYFKSINGSMYFGGTDGLSFFDPQIALAPASPPPILITDILVNNESFKDHLSTEMTSIHQTDELLSDWRKNNIAIQFTSINFKNPEKLVFQYTNNDTAWYDVGNRRNLELINLAPGRHSVKLRAKNPGSSWSAAPYHLSIEIVPPFWKRPYVIAVVAGLFLAVGFTTYRVRIDLLKNLNRTLDKLVIERTREIQLMNEEIMAQNEELTSTTEQLAEKNDLHEESQKELRNLSINLEKKVDERTKEIQLLNQDLRKQYVQLEQFSFIAAHIFRGPVARIQGLIELSMREYLSTEELHTYLNHIKSSANSLDETIWDMNKILNLTKGSPGFFKRIEVYPILKKILLLLKKEKEEKNIRVDIHSFAHLSIRGTKAHVENILYNLIDNAIRYSNPETVPVLKITCRQENNVVKLEFIDNGIGIDLNLARDKVFMPYQRLSDNSGKGLGLYLVKTQAEILGGSVAVTSVPKRGSTFTLTFPNAKPKSS